MVSKLWLAMFLWLGQMPAFCQHISVSVCSAEAAHENAPTTFSWERSNTG
jgi:hypothetical protein